jgi:hypothetical protein
VVAWTVRLEVPAPPVTLAGLKEVVGPEGETVVARDTSLANPLEDITVIVEVPVVPALIVMEAGLAEMAKSGRGGGVDGGPTVTRTATAWNDAPLIPVTPTLYTPRGILPVVQTDNSV